MVGASRVADTFPFNLSVEVPAGTASTAPAEATLAAPWAGRLVEAWVRWPDVDDPLGVRLETGAGVTLLPRPGAEQSGPPGFLEADDVAHTFPLAVDVQDDQDLVAQFTNPTAAAELVSVVVSIARADRGR